ncbi:MAG: DUF4254 domain-containing protein [Bacteroidales bacterium]|jgi:hypothetical protein|nr:DUF4254 domain-containing protein [Bacteroidales bacterium]
MTVPDFNKIFDSTVSEYHDYDNIDKKCPDPYKSDSLEFLLYKKCWIDTVQWHLEDIIRDPWISPVKALEIKRRIDKSNQDRTDMVEYIDSYFLRRFADVVPSPEARINTETPAWAIDRLSILALKIYHMREQSLRRDSSDDHIKKCSEKLSVLLRQREDLTRSVSELLEDLASGKKKMVVYKQMKMYNDPDMNPVLYSKK